MFEIEQIEDVTVIKFYVNIPRDNRRKSEVGELCYRAGKHATELLTIEVNKKYRGRKIGSTLLKIMEGLAPDDKPIYGEVSPFAGTSFAEVRDFYRKNGYKLITAGRHKNTNIRPLRAAKPGSIHLYKDPARFRKIGRLLAIKLVFVI